MVYIYRKNHKNSISTSQMLMYLYPMKELNISLVQHNIVWENPIENLKILEQKIRAVNHPSQLIVLPEMFNSGFTMNTSNIAETMDGASVTWMKNLAQQQKKIICGSLSIKEQDKYYNRLIWALPNGHWAHYDKRHLFSYAGEDLQYSPGNKRMIAQVNGWKICLNICYDLRFPVWARNTDDYDVLLYVANWPQQRNEIWETLLRARAIENQCYVVGVNRVGTDGNGHNYIGNSSIYDPLGTLLDCVPNQEAIVHHCLQKDKLLSARAQFPFLKDRDKFILH